MSRHAQLRNLARRMLALCDISGTGWLDQNEMNLLQEHCLGRRVDVAVTTTKYSLFADKVPSQKFQQGNRAAFEQGFAEKLAPVHRTESRPREATSQPFSWAASCRWRASPADSRARSRPCGGSTSRARCSTSARATTMGDTTSASRS